MRSWRNEPRSMMRRFRIRHGGFRRIQKSLDDMLTEPTLDLQSGLRLGRMS